jgi:hypothetical protein
LGTWQHESNAGSDQQNGTGHFEKLTIHSDRMADRRNE